MKWSRRFSDDRDDFAPQIAITSNASNVFLAGASYPDGFVSVGYAGETGSSSVVVPPPGPDRRADVYQRYSGWVRSRRFGPGYRYELVGLPHLRVRDVALRRQLAAVADGFVFAGRCWANHASSSSCTCDP